MILGKSFWVLYPFFIQNCLIWNLDIHFGMEGEIKSSQTDHDYDDIGQGSIPHKSFYIYGKKKPSSLTYFS